MKNKEKVYMFSNEFGKADCFQNKALHLLFIFTQTTSPFMLQTGDGIKVIYHPHDSALWRHILTLYDFYSSVNWNNLVTTFMQNFKKMFYAIMQDIIVLCPVDYNLQYSVSAKRLARKKTPYSLVFQIMQPPHAQHGRFLLMRDRLSNIFCA